MTEHRKAWDAAVQIIKTLRVEGHAALLAGGCVRDRLLGRTPKDFDVVTDATPERVREVFPRSRQVGAKFGVMLVRKYGHDIEVATFRSDGTYSDGRHPDSVTFGSEVEDARRRDFTINGLFCDPLDGRVIDHVDGRADIEAGIIRTIGSPQQRFAEDHLRMLRAVRFAARLSFSIHHETANAIKRSAERLRSISPERIWMELEMLLTDASRARGWLLLVEMELRAHLCADWPANEDDDALVVARLAALSPSVISTPLALAAVLGSFKLDTLKSVCKGLRLSNYIAATTAWLIGALGQVRAAEALDLAELKTLMAHEAWSDLLELFRVDVTAKGEAIEHLERLQSRAASVDSDRVNPAPLLTGDDLCEMGMQSGPRLGEVLKAVRRAQLNEQITSRMQAESLARELMRD